MKWRPEVHARVEADFNAAVHHSAEARFVHRLHCVKLVMAGCQPADVAEWYERPVRTVERWVRQYTSEGTEGLQDKPRQGRPSTLDEALMRELAGVLARPPREAGYDKRAWTGSLLQELLQSRYQVELSLRQTQRLLKRVQGES